MKKPTEKEVQESIETILKDTASYTTSLNYAFNYCIAAKCTTGHELKVQCLYILNNIFHWKHPKAKEVKEVLKSFAKAC